MILPPFVFSACSDLEVIDVPGIFAVQVAPNVSSVTMVRCSERQAWLIVKCAKVQVLLSDVYIHLKKIKSCSF